MMAVALASSVGVQLSAEEVNEGRVALEAAFGALGLIIAFVGRVRAKGTVYLNPFKNLMVLLVVGALAASALTGCKGTNPTATALTTEDPVQRVENVAFATYGEWVAVHSVAETIVLDPNTPRRVQLAIKDANRKAKPIVDPIAQSFATYGDRVREYQEKLAAGESGDALAAAKFAVAEARKIFEDKVRGTDLTAQTSGMRAAMR
jgi:hypothetical protein